MENSRVFCSNEQTIAAYKSLVVAVILFTCQPQIVSSYTRMYYQYRYVINIGAYPQQLQIQLIILYLQKKNMTRAFKVQNIKDTCNCQDILGR